MNHGHLVFVDMRLALSPLIAVKLQQLQERLKGNLVFIDVHLDLKLLASMEIPAENHILWLII
jgi:hypothetical protein